jgi:hypothetical protein
MEIYPLNVSKLILVYFGQLIKKARIWTHYNTTCPQVGFLHFDDSEIATCFLRFVRVVATGFMAVNSLRPID